MPSPSAAGVDRRQFLVTKLSMGFAIAALVVSTVAFSGCSRQQPESATNPEHAPDTFKVRFDTSKGNVVVTVTRQWAPLGADRFYTLVKSGFYDGVRFYRMVPNFVVQFGIAADPAINAKWHDANLPDDPVTQSNRRGTITYATAGPKTRTTQVFINLADNARLDSDGFAPFGEVTQGMDAVSQFYSGYGDPAAGGAAPAPDRAEAEGNAYFERDFPKMDYIKKATIEK
jgi:peptidyl-prolyl cis-trans isomerase A (cyclophilin A)